MRIHHPLPRWLPGAQPPLRFALALIAELQGEGSERPERFSTRGG